MNLVKLLPHQGQLVQAPFVYPEVRFFFLVAGYASGKTSALVYAILYAVKNLLGKKDLEGHNPKILIGSKNLTFMKKTLTGLLEQDLRDTNSVYTYDKAHNIITVGNVELLLIPVEDESTIYGFSTCCCFLDELDELPTQTATAVVKSINDRCRQIVEGFRSPFMVYTTSAQGLKGTYQTVLHFQKSGIPYVLMRGRTRDNIYLPKDYVDNMYKIYNQKEIDCLLEGKFVSIDSGLVFPDYDPAKNMLEVDLFDCLEENDTVYIGQDFNCIGGNVYIETLKGKVRMKNLKEGDYVLTRMGYKKVVRKVYKGKQHVQKYNNNLVATPDHVAITPKGDIQLCKAQKFYCLSKQSTELLKEKRKILTSLLELSTSLTKNAGILGKLTLLLPLPVNLRLVNLNCLRLFIGVLMDDLQKTSRFTTSMVMTMITDLKTLWRCTRKTTRESTRIIYDLDRMIQNLQDLLEDNALLTVESRLDAFKAYVKEEKHFIYVLFSCFLIKNAAELAHTDTNYALNFSVFYNEKLSSILLKLTQTLIDGIQTEIQRDVVFKMDIKGKKEQNCSKKVQDVYDIEVEDCHEFFANDILVHNCFGNHAVALVVKKFTNEDVCIVAIKDYDFPDIRKAPQVFRYDFPTQKIVWIPDMTYKEHFSEFKKELRNFDIKIAYRACNPLVNDRVFACNKLLYAERLFITPICKNLEKALLTHQRDPKTGMPMKGGVKAPDHDSDAFGMAVHYLLSWNRDLKPL